jgi:hypothetical protein
MSQAATMDCFVRPVRGRPNARPRLRGQPLRNHGTNALPARLNRLIWRYASFVERSPREMLSATTHAPALIAHEIVNSDHKP